MGEHDPSTTTNSVSRPPGKIINPSPKSLLSLPQDLLANICLQLDRKTALALLLVDRSLHRPAETLIYRDARISVPTSDYIKDQIATPPPARQTVSTRSVIRLKNLHMATQRELIMANRTKGMLAAYDRVDSRRSFIRSITVQLDSTSHSAWVKFLCSVKRHPTEMRVEGCVCERALGPCLAEHFWYTSVHPLRQTECFSRLSMLDIVLTVCHCPSSVISLLSLMPTLRRLRVYGDCSTHDGDIPCPPIESQIADHESFLPRLIEFAYIHKSFRLNRTVEALSTYIATLPSLRKLSYRSIIDSPMADHMLTAPHSGSPDDPPSTGMAILDYRGSDVNIHTHFPLTSFASLVMLVTTCDIVCPQALRLEFFMLPEGLILPCLKWWIIDTELYANPVIQPAPSRQSPQASLPITSTTLSLLSAVPRLEVVQIGGIASPFTQRSSAQWASMGTEGIIIQTIEYQGRTLSYLQTFSRSAPVGAYPPDEPPDELDDSDEEFECTIQRHNPDGTITSYEFGAFQSSKWSFSTDFEGVIIPCWIVEEMKRVDDRADVWKGRNIETTAEAWQVLLDWRRESGVQAVGGHWEVNTSW